MFTFLPSKIPSTLVAITLPLRSFRNTRASKPFEETIIWIGGDIATSHCAKIDSAVSSLAEQFSEKKLLEAGIVKILRAFSFILPQLLVSITNRINRPWIS